MAEIADLLPEGSIQEDEPEVEAEKKKGKNGYYHTYQQHADWYGSSLRTVKRWVAVGKKEGEFCPLDDPEKLYAWLDKYLQKAVPAGVLKALISWRKENGVTSPEPAEELVVEHPDEESAAEDERQTQLGRSVSKDEMGLEAALNRLEEMEVRLSRIATQPGGAKPWLDTISRMTSVSTKLREEMEKLGQLLPKELAEGIIIELLQPIEQGMRGMYSELCSVTGIVPCPKAQAAWDKACDALFVRFGKEVFGEVQR